MKKMKLSSHRFMLHRKLKMLILRMFRKLHRSDRVRMYSKLKMLNWKQKFNQRLMMFSNLNRLT